MSRELVQYKDLINKIEEYGQACMDVGFFEKGSQQYTEAFKQMIQNYADCLELLANGKLSGLKLYPES